MKKLDKVLSVLMIVIMLACICTSVFAADTSILDKVNAKENIGTAGDSMAKLGSTILTFITNAAMILAVVIIAILGIKYMMGSTEEKAEYKKSLVPYFIGAVLVFGAGVIGRMVVGLVSSFGA